METIRCKAAADYSPRKVRRGDVLDLDPDDVLIKSGVCVPSGDDAGDPEPADPAQDVLRAEHVGGGWYEILRDGQVVDRIRGSDAAARRMEQLREGDD